MTQNTHDDSSYLPVCTADRLDLDCFMEGLVKRNPGENNFQTVVRAVAQDVFLYLKDHNKCAQDQILERLTEPDRIITFRVTWQDDRGNIRANRGWRVQYSNALGPYKGGLRFHKDVTLDDLKFLGFEQCFKNALTGLPIGGAKGGANFNPKGKSDGEIMRFCKAFMIELHRYIGPDIDIPAGDIGVGDREISYLFGEYKRLENKFHGVLTGKNIGFGGSMIRKEATGYGNVIFASQMLEQHDMELKGKKCVISGAGNVAIFTAEKAITNGAKVITLSDSKGMIHDKNGLDQEKLEVIKKIKLQQNGTLESVPEHFKDIQYYKDKKPWDIACDMAFPCATQNELQEKDAKTLVDNGVKLVSEGANMPCTAEAIKHFYNNGVLYGPGKAANAGGVAVSALELTQNAMRLRWSADKVEKQLIDIMSEIHDLCAQFGHEYGKTKGNRVDYKTGANIAGFSKLANALSSYGVV